MAILKQKQRRRKCLLLFWFLIRIVLRYTVEHCIEVVLTEIETMFVYLAFCLMIYLT